MWLILSAGLRRWAFGRLVLPLVGRGARRLGERAQAKGASTPLSRGLLRAASIASPPPPPRRRGLLRGRRKTP